jgi:hypothetical protein
VPYLPETATKASLQLSRRNGTAGSLPSPLFPYMRNFHPILRIGGGQNVNFLTQKKRELFHESVIFATGDTPLGKIFPQGGISKGKDGTALPSLFLPFDISFLFSLSLLEPTSAKRRVSTS